MTNAIFITGIGTDVGKTVVAAILAEALEADYWKPVQAGFQDGTDAQFVQSVLSNKTSVVHPETYKLRLAASPHIAARQEGIKIDLDKIRDDFNKIVNEKTSNVKGETSNLKLQTSNFKPQTSNLIIEGAGGLMVPLNDEEFVADLIRKLGAKVILVSRNYLGSINHSLWTAAVCKQDNLDVFGWVFNDQYLNYENEIVQWSRYPAIASIPSTNKIDSLFIKTQASIIKNSLASFL